MHLSLSVRSRLYSEGLPVKYAFASYSTDSGPASPAPPPRSYLSDMMLLPSSHEQCSSPHLVTSCPRLVLGIGNNTDHVTFPFLQLFKIARTRRRASVALFSGQDYHSSYGPNAVAFRHQTRTSNRYGDLS